VCARTSPLEGLWTHTKGGFYHDGRFANLINHYDSFKSLHLTDQEKKDLVEYLKSLYLGQWLYLGQRGGLAAVWCLWAHKIKLSMRMCRVWTAGQDGSRPRRFLPSFRLVAQKE
jgi:hypothetical protein